MDATDKKISRKEKDERILWKKNEVAEYEATTFSIFYNNALFLAILIICSFYIFKTFTPVVNYVGAMSLAAGVVALLSTASHRLIPTWSRAKKQTQTRPKMPKIQNS